jgi:hypothetical protein
VIANEVNLTEKTFITPPPELVQQWVDEKYQYSTAVDLEGLQHFLVSKSAQWGADQELEACCEWLKLEGHEHEHEALLAARRPKPPRS